MDILKNSFAKRLLLSFVTLWLVHLNLIAQGGCQMNGGTIGCEGGTTLYNVYTSTITNYHVNATEGTDYEYVDGGTSGSTALRLRWLKAGTYQVDFTLSCGTTHVSTVVASTSGNPGTLSASSQKVCSGEAPSSVSVNNLDGVIQKWEKSSDGTNWTVIQQNSSTFKGTTLSSSLMETGPGWEYRVTIRQCQTDHELTHAVNSEVVANTPTVSSLGGSCGVMNGYWSMTLNQTFATGTVDEVRFYIRDTGGLLHGTDGDPTTFIVDEPLPSTNAWKWDITNVANLGFTPAKIQAVPYKSGVALCASGEVDVSTDISTNPADPTGIDFKVDGSSVSSIAICESSSKTVSVNLDKTVQTVSYSWTISGTTAGEVSSTSSLVIQPGMVAGYAGKIYPGYYQVRVTWHDGCNGGEFVEAIQVTLDAAGGTASADQSICPGDDTGLNDITLTGRVGTVVQWEKKIGTGSWSPISGTNTIALSKSKIDLNNAAQYRAKVQNSAGNCVEYSTISTVNILEAPGTPTSSALGGSCSTANGFWSISLTQTLSDADQIRFVINDGGLNHGLPGDPTQFIATIKSGTSNVWQWSTNSVQDLGFEPESFYAMTYKNGSPLCKSGVVSVSNTVESNPTDPSEIDILRDGSEITSLSICESGTATVAASLDVTPAESATYRWTISGSGAGEVGSTSSLTIGPGMVPGYEDRVYPGIYMVTVDWNDGCNSGSLTKNITVSIEAAGGATSGDQTICSGDASALSNITLTGSIGSVAYWQSKLTSQDWSQATSISVTSATLNASYLDENTAKDYRAVVTNGHATAPCYEFSSSSRVNIRTDIAQTPSAPSTSDGDACGGFSAFEIRNDDLSLSAGTTVWHRITKPDNTQIDIQSIEAPGNPGDYRTSFDADDHGSASGNYEIATIYKYSDQTYSCESGSITVAVSSLPTPPVATDIIIQDCSNPINCIEYPQSGSSTPLYFFEEEYVTLWVDTNEGQGSSNTTVSWVDNSGVIFDTDYEAVLPMIEGFNYQVQMNWESPVCNTRTGSLSEFFSLQFKTTGNTILPAFSDVWVIGDAHNLTWPKQGSDPGPTYDIYVRSESGGPWTPVASGVVGVENDGELSTSVTVPTVSTGNYRFMVMESGKNFLYKSPVINIVNSIPGAQTITTFEDGQLLVHDNSYAVNWPGTAGKEYVVKQNGVSITNTDDATFNWQIPADIEGPGNTLQMLSLDGTENFVTAPVEFVRSLIVHSPNLDTKYGLGETIVLTWGGGSESNAGRPYKVRLISVIDGVTSHTPIDATTEKFWNWTIPVDLNTSGTYKIEVQQFAKTDGVTDPNEDQSDLYFTVVDCPNSRTWSSADRNYVKTYTAREPLLGCISAYDDENKVQEGIQYLDDLGREEQTVLREATPAGLDLISMVEYDEWGRMSKSYLPFPGQTNTGYYQNDALTEQQTYYGNEYTTADGLVAYSKSIYEFEASSRVIENTNPGTTWSEGSGHTQEMEYSGNVAEDNIKALKSDLSGNIIDKGFYATGSLHGTFSYDENAGEQEGEVISWVNRSGQVVLKSVKLNELSGVKTYAHTYSIYDDRGNLRHVVQPEGIRLILEEAAYDWNSLNDDSFQKNWMFSYAYDHRNRMIGKRVPGADWVSMVYDKRDRLVATQNGNQHKLTEVVNGSETVNQYVGSSYIVESGDLVLGIGFHVKASEKPFYASAIKSADDATGEWMVTKYDALNRPVMTGLKEMEKERTDVQSNVDVFYNAGVITETYDGGADFHGYDNTSFPNTLSEDELLTVNYYDTYDFTSESEPSGARTALVGRMTGGETRILDTDMWLSKVNYFDVYYRPIKTIADNHLGGQDIITSEFRNSISPLVESSTRTHSDGVYVSLDIVESSTYDHRDRMLKMTHSIDGATPAVLSENTYDQRGRLVIKDLGGTSSPVQSVDYAYNIRGWLSSINGGTNLTGSDKFGMELNYASGNQYNGNIGQLTWKALGLGDAIGQSQRYSFNYDAANRLLGATYSNLDNTATNNYYSVSGISYDHNGNIETLNRNAKRNNASSTMDQLTYGYHGNRLVTVEDGGDQTAHTDPANDRINELKDYGFFDGVSLAEEYQYDANGNMIYDANKGVSSIQYNHLNLPSRVTIDGITIDYTYNAVGVKLSKEVTNGNSITVTDYVRGIHYTNSGLSFIQHDEGRAVKSGSLYNYEYNLTDHLGNIRVTVDDNGSVVQRQDYYPFGLSFNEGTISPENQYKYNGVERDATTRIYEMAYRGYEASLGQFMQIDPLAELFESYDPYHFGFNNPTLYNDPLGLAGQCFACGGGGGSKMKDKAEEFRQNSIATGNGNVAASDIHTIDNEGNMVLNSDIGGSYNLIPYGTHTYLKSTGELLHTKVDGYDLVSSESGHSQILGTISGWPPSAEEHRNFYTGLALFGEAKMFQIERRITKALENPNAYKGLRHEMKLKAQAAKGIGKRFGWAGVALSFWEASEKGWTVGATTMFILDTGVAIISSNPALAPIGLVYGAGRLGADVAGYDPAKMIDDFINDL